MVATRVIATPNDSDAMTAMRKGNIGVALYHAGTTQLPGLGSNLSQSVVKQLPQPPSVEAWDFLSIALAVFAADRFVLRANAEDGWTRVIALDVAVSNPVPWIPHLKRLAATLRFLTGDIWQLSLRSGGISPPTFSPRMTDRDAICLFSGGLDSLLGAIKLLNDGKHPFLVSQGSPKEISPQKYLANALKLDSYRFDGRVTEKWHPPYEGSTRSRSIIFFAYGIVAASSHGLNELFIPENGLIAINPPFTARRFGSLSTRTTHPYFLEELEVVLRAVGLDIALTNLFEGMTKGEMLAGSSRSDIETLAAESYSCGKGKRINMQCGRCIPCLIRRASFQAAGLTDRTKYKVMNLSGSAQHDDVLAARLATTRVARLSSEDIARWAGKAGPLPMDIFRRKNITDGVERGFAELAGFLDGVRWL
ncbi:hypothetical protein ABF87_07955 [Nitrosomonas sp. JL21]|uniref:Qat anti-phage system QueC-like protein QatC n=1 Tax=Nitrosomonas sp. JL21 TaxID=153949 RepID=UPI0013709C4F|nr:Qat anti-phage system QueC-like protein QatC [Nitrosomonas sp. JL21]MXS77897.1 hypothetical protein [Nitrosomonas sp. JL21]